MIAIYKQHRQKSGFCFHLRAIRNSVSLKFMELCMETPCLCPSEGHKHDVRDVAKTSVAQFCYWNETFTLELPHIEIDASSSARIVLYFDLRDSNFRPPFYVTQRKAWKFERALLQKENPSS